MLRYNNKVTAKEYFPHRWRVEINMAKKLVHVPCDTQPKYLQMLVANKEKGQVLDMSVRSLGSKSSIFWGPAANVRRVQVWFFSVSVLSYLATSLY